MRPKGMKNWAALSAREVESSSRGKRRVFFCRRTVRIEVKSQVIPTSFIKIEERGRSLGRRTGEKGTVNRISR